MLCIFLGKKINHKVWGLYFFKQNSQRSQIMRINIANVFAISLCDTLFLEVCISWHGLGKVTPL